MRILQVIPAFSTSFGGTSSVVRMISKELAKKHEVTVYTTSALDHTHDSRSYPSEAWLDNYHVFYFPRVFTFTGYNISLSMMRNLPVIVKDYDIIHLHSWRNFQDIIVNYYGKKNKIPYVLQAHGSLPKMASKQGLKRLYDKAFGCRLLNDASMVIAFNSMEAKQCQSLGVPESKISVVPNGIDLTKFTHLPHSGFFRKKFCISEGKKIILYLGRINKTKGIDFLITAYAAMIKASNHNNTILVVAGPDDGHLNSLKLLARTLDLTRKEILFTGLLTEHEKMCALVDSAIVVYPSPFEPFGLVSLEAAASYKPVIVSSNTPMATTIKEGGFGFSVPYGNINELSESIDKLIDNDQLLQDMGRKGHDIVFQNYDLACVVSKLEGVYKDTISKS